MSSENNTNATSDTTLSDTTSVTTTTTVSDATPTSDTTRDADEYTIETYVKFEHMNLKENLLRGIYAYGFNEPSTIQQKAIVPFALGKEIIAQAQSGTGKTGTFSIGLLQAIDETLNTIQALVLLPTRELSFQVAEVISKIGNVMNIGVMTCVGGTDWKLDVAKLKSGTVQIVVGTPGRVYDMLLRKAITPNTVNIVVLDEADEMLSEDGFQDCIYDIIQELSPKIQIGLYSATMPQKVLDLTKKFMKNPVEIIVKQEELTLEGIRQFYIGLHKESAKVDVIFDLYNDISINSSIIFCNSKKHADDLTKVMRENDFAVSCTHGALTTEERNTIMKKFKNGETRVLITTDLLARGIDVQTVSVVINYDLPRQLELYLHRIGRSGRYGRKGLAINLVTNRDLQLLHDIEKFYDTEIEELPANVSQLVSF